MLTVNAIDTGIFYEFTVTDGTKENTFIYNFAKTPPDSVENQVYLQNCKNESLALAQWEIDQKIPPKELTI
ncbi:MAG: hypothetical protein Q8906_05970 [Bacillota bacterium]|nr:hypothetical protein [Bacillota bacterium]